MTLYRSALAFAAVALVPLTQAWNIELPPCVEPFKPFVYSGCFQDGSPNALVFRSSLDQRNMTVEKCIADCKGNGFRYAGLEYYGVCFCGATVNGPQLDESKCSFPCSGNKTEKCGGDKSLSVWQDPTFAKSPSDVTVDDYKSVGCYTDDSTKGRTLSYPVDLDASTFTTKSCLAACEKQGFPFAGVEYGKECWCGVVLANDTAKVADSECNIPCKGDSSLTCGGRSRLNLWVAKDLESLEPCGQKPATTTSLPPITMTTKPVDTTSTTKPADTTTTKPVGTTTTNPAETTSTADETTTTKPADTRTTKPADTTTTKPVESTTACDETTTTKPIDTTTTKPVDSTTTRLVETTTTKPVDTTSTNPVDTTTTKKPVTTTSSCGETTSIKPITTTFKPTTTTKDVSHTTTKLCTATVTVPPKCEWQCGNWCAPALPHWGDKNGCRVAQKTCHKQVNSCFKNAGWPGAIECFKFKAWCHFIDSYCYSSCPGNSCGKWDCWNKHHGGGGKPPGNPPTTTTSVYPCPTTSKPAPTATKPATTCPPQPTNICTQPTNDKYGYGPGKPVGGIPLPVVGCNDCEDEFEEKPFKFYTDADTRKCPGFPWPQWPNVCAQSCKEQYIECVATYSKGCDTLGWKDNFHKRTSETDEEFTRRWSSSSWSSWSWGSGSDSGSKACAVAGSAQVGAWATHGSDSVQCWGWGGNKPSWAIARCKVQYQDCLNVNQWVNPKDKCKHWPGC
ncbi:hypothetical protein QQS21_009157 [Conoideocrella luteorostrata]|uniref:WSC domain-containing protein n=1 Tax=Conoideocrella luteorostrata TaxID=1105319 RepID=A0AAJ0CID0_9HYPO|nr:hypothetical protein QQS21_009157 [Conoideocrella luteorostrata]